MDQERGELKAGSGEESTVSSTEGGTGIEHCELGNYKLFYPILYTFLPVDDES